MDHIQNIISRVLSYQKIRLLDLVNNKVFDDCIKLLLKYQDYNDLIVNFEEGHYKFWGWVERNGKTYISYGKIGRDVKEEESPLPFWKLGNKCSEKMRNGYRPVFLSSDKHR